MITELLFISSHLLVTIADINDISKPIRTVTGSMVLVAIRLTRIERATPTNVTRRVSLKFFSASLKPDCDIFRHIPAYAVIVI